MSRQVADYALLCESNTGEDGDGSRAGQKALVAAEQESNTNWDVVPVTFRFRERAARISRRVGYACCLARANWFTLTCHFGPASLLQHQCYPLAAQYGSFIGTK